MSAHKTPPIQFTKSELAMLLDETAAIIDGRVYRQRTQGRIHAAVTIRAKIRAALETEAPATPTENDE
jgi:hypothetical protein